jgi:hypothetical protein
MGTGTRRRSFSGELVRLAAALALVMAASGLYVSDAFAGDLSAQATPSGQASAASTAGSVLAQTNTLSQPAESWFKDFHVSGFLNETGGMWINPTTLKQFTPSRNNLATARTWLQVDENYRLNANNQFFMREWFVYEPPYSFNSANNHIYNCTNAPAEPCGNTGFAQMQELNDFYNQYTVRDAWWKLTAGPLTLYTGNQIVVWGQSLAFRVGDVINPQDTNWNFGFANLEQSRMPQWMIHPILNLPDWGALNSNFLEGVFIPGTQPLWNSVAHPDGRYADQYDIAGRVNNGFPAANHGPSARFDVSYPYFYPGRTLSADGNPFTVYPGGANMVAPPFNRVFDYCTNFPNLRELIPANHSSIKIPASLRRPCNFAPTGGAPVVVGAWHVPPVTWRNMEEGVRFHTLIGSSEITALFFNSQQYYPVVSWVPYTGQFPLIFEPVQYAGATIDRPVPMPPSLAEYFPLVARAEAVYQNHAPFVNLNLTQPDAIRYSDIVTWMFALDLDQAYAPWLTTTGNLSANFEFLDMIDMDGVNNLLDGPNGGDISANALKNDVSMLFNVGTSYWWNAFAPTWTMIYEPHGTTFALFPSIQLNPPWTNKYFAKIGVIYVLSSAINYVSPALFKGENMITVSGQYNFSAM